MRNRLLLIAAVAVLLLLIAGPGAGGPLDKGSRVSLDFDDTPIATVLKMLATQNNLNLVISSEVGGNVSLRISDVSLTTALDAILLPNGYNYYLSDDVIIIKNEEQKVAGELMPKAYRLKYLTAGAAEVAVTPLLSPKGKVIRMDGQPQEQQTSGEANPRSSEIVVFDYPAVHELVASLIPEIDKKKRQISVEAKIIETYLYKNEKLGINWPKSVSSTIEGVPTPGVSGTSTAGAVSKAGVMPLESGNWQLGSLTVDQVDLLIDFLQQRDNSKLLSNPRLTTLENETAVINAETVIPIQTINRFSEGAVIQDIVTFQDEKIGISLEVTPWINDDSTITMRVHPVVEEIIGSSGPPENEKPITSQRSVITTVVVKNNETIALGGLLKETTLEKKSGIFFLGSLPLLGPLFTHTSVESKTTDLLILITPRILE